VPKTKKAIALSSQAKMLLVVTSEPNLDPGRSDAFVLSNFGSEPEVGTLHIDTDPGELHKPVRFIYEQTGPAFLISGAPPSATYEASFRAIKVPVQHSFLAIIDKMNEGQFLKLGPNDKGICIIPVNRRALILDFLGFASVR
jgi:hypothetical protein